MSRRNLKKEREGSRSTEVSTIPRQLDLRVHDLDALNEIELYAGVLSAVAATDRPLTAAEIRELIRQGYRDVNEIKSVTRAGLGACGSKTCAALIQRIFREQGVPADAVTQGVRRPLFVEVSLGVFAGVREATDG